MVPVGWGAESAGRGFVPVLVGCGVPCPQVGEGGAVRYGGVVLCGGLPVGGGGHRVQVWWGGLSPVVCPLAVWGSPAWSLDRPPLVFQYVGTRARVGGETGREEQEKGRGRRRRSKHVERGLEHPGKQKTRTGTSGGRRPGTGASGEAVASKRKCFSNALRHTLVVLEMH